MLRLLLATVLLCAARVAVAAPVAIVAAETVYGDIARQVGGEGVRVTSILSNPDQDPHLFEASPSVARAVSDAAIVIVNGAGYDPWMSGLLAAARSAHRRVIDVGALSGHGAGDNPHVWYDIAAAREAAKAIAAALDDADPTAAAAHAEGLTRFEASLRPIEAHVAAMRARFAGAPVAATEPVFGYMFAGLGLDVRGEAFALAVMNDTEPAASDVARFEADLRDHRIRLLVFNAQAKDPIAERMAALARAARVPVVGVTETEPAGTGYQAWLTGTLDAIDAALSR